MSEKTKNRGDADRKFSPQKFSQGSAKDLEVLDSEFVALRFCDRISVFDFGALPDEIPGRGSALFESALAVDEFLKSQGILTATDINRSRIEGRLVQKLFSHPKHAFDSRAGRFVPLEFVFRLGAGSGSSLLRRDPKVRLGERFSVPRVELYTKLEAQDRLLSSQEACSLLEEFGFHDCEGLVSRASRIVDQAASALGEFFSRLGLTLWDGKFELGLTANGELELIDALTPDEFRVTLPGMDSVPLSKELLRLWLEATPWAEEVRRHRSPDSGWQNRLTLPPPRLGPWRVQRLASLYKAWALVLKQKRSDALLEFLRDPSRPSVFVMGKGGREEALRMRLVREGARSVDNITDADSILVSQDGDLADGLVDSLLQQGRFVYGPTKEAARIEWSKSFGREIATDAGIPIPRWYRIKAGQGVGSQVEDFSKTLGHVPVLKKDGLAGGKGVVLPSTVKELAEVATLWSKDSVLLLEERLSGWEASIFFYCSWSASGPLVQLMGSARDFKRRFAGDEGPNTGGMGSWSPHPQIGADEEKLFSSWAHAVLLSLSARGTKFRGFLYLGVMYADSGFKLIEFNARLGDPETQSLMMTWEPSKPILRSLFDLSLSRTAAAPECQSVCLALVNPDYPSPAQALTLPPWDLPGSGAAIELIKTNSTQGRVAYLVARGDSYQEAADEIYRVWVESPWKNLLDWRPDVLP